jgi:ribokinase
MLARGFGMFLGGKGFNQAIACRRLGAEVTMVGRVGADQFGDMFLAKLGQEGVAADRVVRDAEAGTAIASPVVDENGENSIIAAPRANMRVSPADVEAASAAIAAADILMLQFEIPVAASRRAGDIARNHDTLVMLDPAPVEHGFERFAAPLDYLVPNETEAHVLAAGPAEVRSQNADCRMKKCGGGPEEWGGKLLAQARKAVVVSLGAQGALAVDRTGLRGYPAHRVEVVDTTGAGDAFRAGLAVKIAEGAPLDEAVRFANACGALACTVFGTEPSMPKRADVERLLAAHRKE